MTYRGISGWVLVGLVGGALAQGCGGSAESSPRSGSGGTLSSAGKDAGSMTVDPPPQAGTDGESPYNVLCGIPDKGCVPDQESSCSKVIVAGAGGTGVAGGGSSGSGGGGSGGVGEGATSQGGAGAGAGESGGGGVPGGQGGEGQAGGAGESSLGGAPGAAGEAAVSGAGGGAGRGGSGGQAAGGAGRDPGVMLQPLASCQVREGNKGRPIAECSAGGLGIEGSACFSAADCEPGLGCVGEGPGRCRRYCCEGPTTCLGESDRHCTEQPLAANPPTSKTLMVPVCMPAIQCSLAEPYPCELPGTCSCPEKSACVVVRDDGLTSCVPESTLPDVGKGVEGTACPCAWGFVCSHATEECVKLCQVVAPTECESRRCQASPSLPDGWGTCVGVARSAGAD